MVTKLTSIPLVTEFGYILAKNHMVTKLNRAKVDVRKSYILAKNHMVTKHFSKRDLVI